MKPMKNIPAGTILYSLGLVLMKLKIDYGAVLYGSAANTHLKKVDRIQYSSIKICLEALKSSPINAILVEAQEPPLEFRRYFLSYKRVVRWKYFQCVNPLNINIFQLYIENLTNKYWSNKNFPPLVEAYSNLPDCIKSTTESKKLPIFKIDFSIILFKPTVILPKYTDIEHSNRAVLNFC